MSQLVLQTTTLTTPQVGTLEYDGKVPYFTPQKTERGVVPGMQYYRLNSPLVGLNSTADQPIFGFGVTLSSNTVYAFELVYCVTKSAGVTSHTVSNFFGGTATVNNIAYRVTTAQSSATGAVNGSPGTTTDYGLYIAQASATAITPAITVASQAVFPSIRGTVSVNTGGTFIPSYKVSAAPGGAYSTQIGSFFAIYPIGAAGGNTSVGAWA